MQVKQAQLHKYLCWVHDTYCLVVVLKGNICVSSLECVVGSVIPCNIIDPVGSVVVPKKGRQKEKSSIYIRMHLWGR